MARVGQCGGRVGRESPFLAPPGGGRLFDHNRNASDFDNYVIAAPDFAIWGNANVCMPPSGPQRARLVFAADFSERRESALAPDGE